MQTTTKEQAELDRAKAAKALERAEGYRKARKYKLADQFYAQVRLWTNRANRPIA